MLEVGRALKIGIFDNSCIVSQRALALVCDGSYTDQLAVLGSLILKILVEPSPAREPNHCAQYKLVHNLLHILGNKRVAAYRDHKQFTVV